MRDESLTAQLPAANPQPLICDSFSRTHNLLRSPLTLPVARLSYTPFYYKCKYGCLFFCPWLLQAILYFHCLNNHNCRAPPLAKISLCAVWKIYILLPQHFIPLPPPMLAFSSPPLAGFFLWVVAYVLMVFSLSSCHILKSPVYSYWALPIYSTGIESGTIWLRCSSVHCASHSKPNGTAKPLANRIASKSDATPVAFSLHSAVYLRPMLTANKDQDCYTAQMSTGCQISIASIPYHHITTTHIASWSQKSSIHIQVLHWAVSQTANLPMEMYLWLTRLSWDPHCHTMYVFDSRA